MEMVACESWKICQTAFNASSISCNTTHAQNDYAKVDIGTEVGAISRQEVNTQTQASSHWDGHLVLNMRMLRKRGREQGELNN